MSQRFPRIGGESEARRMKLLLARFYWLFVTCRHRYKAGIGKEPPGWLLLASGLLRNLARLADAAGYIYVSGPFPTDEGGVVNG